MIAILGLFSSWMSLDADDLHHTTLETWENLKQNEKEGLPDVIRVKHAPFVDWELLTSADYESVYSLFQSGDFFSQFSLKRRYRLEPFLPILLPQDPAEVKKWSNSAELSGTEENFNAQIEQVKSDINLTLHELYREQFLTPLRNWCLERNIPLQYTVLAEDSVPISYLMKDATFLRHATVISHQHCSRACLLAVSAREQCGVVEKPDFLPENTLNTPAKEPTGVIVLFSDNTLCRDLDAFLGASACCCEFQMEYAMIKITAFEGIPTPVVTIGPGKWKSVELSAPLSSYRPETLQFLKRFHELGGKIVSNDDNFEMIQKRID